MNFRKLEADAVVQRLTADLVGGALKDIEWREFDWVFVFAAGVLLRVASPWRVVSEGRLSFAEADDGQLFGLAAPVDGAKKSKELLLGTAVDRVSIREDTADLTIAFRGDIFLEIWSNSSGYEPWELSGRDFKIVATGGGRLAIWGIDVESEKPSYGEA